MKSYPYYVVTTKTLQIDLAAVSSSSEVAPRDSSLRSRMTTRGDIAKDLGIDKVLDVTSYYNQIGKPHGCDETNNLIKANVQ